MNQQQSWQRVTELFEQALERAPEERSEFLKSACAGDDVLLREVESHAKARNEFLSLAPDDVLLCEVESLLAQHNAETGFLESPAVAVVADQIVEKGEQLPIGGQLGHY